MLEKDLLMKISQQQMISKIFELKPFACFGNSCLEHLYDDEQPVSFNHANWPTDKLSLSRQQVDFFEVITI